MKRFISLFSASVLFIWCYAQQRGASKINADDFPTISFVWNEYNPNRIPGNQVSLKEDDQVCSFTWMNTVSHPVKKNKSVVILWEDMRSHGEQSDFTSAMLRYFFLYDIQKNDYFNIITFNRDKGDGAFLQSITHGFTNDLSEIRSALSVHINSMDLFSAYPYSTNIYQAVNEAISILDTEPKENLKTIVLISAGMNMNTAGAPKEFVSAEALKRNIPIYIVKYPLNGDYSGKDIEGIEKITFGDMIIPEYPRDDYGTAAQLEQAYTDMALRHYGQDYMVTFTSLRKRDGKTHTILLSVNGIDHQFTYTAPDFSLTLWMQENIGITIAAGCALFVILALIIFLIVYAVKKRKEKDLAFQRENEQLQAKMAEQQKEMQAKLDAERKIREGAAFAAQKKEEAILFAEQQKKLENIMSTKNLYPRLVFSVDGEHRTEVIKSPITKIGRDASNDIVIDKPTISRTHAVITFNGSNFEIQNVSRTNKTIVNGQFIDQSGLKGNDIIGIGEIVINFYI